ncbi:STAS domain-containing protein [Jatrophihabitans sp. YIM 134969]
MSGVPMVQIGRVLVATLGDELDDSAALAFQDDIGHRVVADRATGVLLDISSLEVVDSFICRVLGDTATIVSILGARVALVGMRPAVAITLVELGLPLAGVTTARDLEHGLRAVTAPPTHRAR